jgi:hypothetical protein
MANKIKIEESNQERSVSHEYTLLVRKQNVLCGRILLQKTFVSHISVGIAVDTPWSTGGCMGTPPQTCHF